MSLLPSTGAPRSPWAGAVALVLGGAGCQAGGAPVSVDVLSLAVTTQSGPTTVSGNVPAPCELDVDFGSVPVGLTSAGSIAITNHGKSAVSFRPFGADLDPEFGLTVAAFNLPTLQPGDSTSFPVAFQSARAGTASSTFSIPTSLAAGSCGSSGAVVIKLSGTGVAAGALAVTPSDVDFGNVLVGQGASRIVTLSNPSPTAVTSITCVLAGADANLFTVTGCPAALAAMATASIAVSFAPLALEASSVAVVTFMGGSGPAATLNLAGEPIASDLTLAPNPVDYGYVPPGTTALGCTTMTNQTSLPVTFESLTDFVGEGPFSLSPVNDATPPLPVTLPIVIDPAQTARVCFVFQPTATQDYTGMVTLVTNAPADSEPILQLTGWGGGPQITCTPPSLDFGLTLDGIASTMPVICTNSGTADPLNLNIYPPIANPAVFSAQFDQTSDVYPLAGLAPGESARIDVSYDPTMTSTDKGVLIIRSNGGQGQAVQIPIAGQGVNIQPCRFVLTPSQLEFGNVMVGNASMPLTVEIDNVGSDVCLVQAPAIEEDPSGSFQLLASSIQPDPQSGEITIPAPGPGVTSSLELNLAFSPSANGVFSAELAFGITDPSAPEQTVPLEGTSASTCLAVEPSTLQFGTVAESGSGALSCGAPSRSFTVFDTCDSMVTLQSLAIQSGPGDLAPQFSLMAGVAVPYDVTALEDGVVFTLSFEPTTVGLHTAQLLASDGTVDTAVFLSGSAVGSSNVTDSFVVAPPEADVLFVMDVAYDTVSQADLVNAAPGFFRAASGIDYRVALTTDNVDATIATAELGRLLPCPTCSIAGVAPTIISPASIPDGGAAADPSTAFTALVQTVPTDGFAPTSPLGEHFFLALYDALQNDPAPGVDFFRPGAAFADITVTNNNLGNDSQGGAGDRSDTWYETFFEAYFMSQPGFSWNFVNAGTTPTGTGFSDPGQLPINIDEMLSATGGIAVNTSDPMWETSLDTFWEAVSAASGTFPLSATPVQGLSGIAVTVDGVTVNQLAGSGNFNWTYLAASNAIQFTANYSLESGDTIAITYSVCQ